MTDPQPSAWAVLCDDVTHAVCLTELAAKLRAQHLREQNKGRHFEILVVPLYGAEAGELWALRHLREALGDPAGELTQDELVERARNAWADAQRYRWLSAHARSTAEHWRGRWSLVIEGPPPMRNDCADSLDVAVDAAMARTQAA
jgi:hypothetical protein